MAKKKKKTGKSPRRRVSGAKGSGTIMEILTLTGGAVAAQYAAVKFADKLEPKYMAGAQIAVGVLLAMKGKGLVVALGKGIGVSGCLSAAKEFGVLTGIGAAPLVTFSDNSLGFPRQNVIQGYGLDNPGAVMNGMSGLSEMAVISGNYDY